MTEGSIARAEAVETRPAVNVRHSRTINFWNCIALALFVLVVGFGLWMYITSGLEDIKQKEQLDELKARSPAHARILSGYYRCMSPRQSPGHMACLGAVAKSAELNGTEPSVVSAVLVDAGLLAPPAEKAP